MWVRGRQWRRKAGVALIISLWTACVNSIYARRLAIDWISFSWVRKSSNLQATNNKKSLRKCFNISFRARVALSRRVCFDNSRKRTKRNSEWWRKNYKMMWRESEYISAGYRVLLTRCLLVQVYFKTNVLIVSICEDFWMGGLNHISRHPRSHLRREKCINSGCAKPDTCE